MFATWPENYIKEFDPGIEYLELFALVATMTNWIHRYRNENHPVLRQSKCSPYGK